VGRLDEWNYAALRDFFLGHFTTFYSGYEQGKHMALPDKANNQFTAIAGTGETTIVTADPGYKNAITSILISTPNAAVSTLTLRDGTGGTTKHVFNYPNTAAAPLAPVEVMFDPPLCAEAKNTNWTMQASVNASGFNVTVNFVKQ
jgi:hypothetical protein